MDVIILETHSCKEPMNEYLYETTDVFGNGPIQYVSEVKNICIGADND